MPVSGNEEQPGVLSWPLLDVSAGIPLKKRRLLLVPPPSPPRHESPSSPMKEETDDLKKIDEAQSSPCNETDDGKKIDEAESSPCKETDNLKKIDEAESSPCKETDNLKKIDEAESSPCKDTDDLKKIDEAESSPCKDTDDLKKIDGSCSDSEKEESIPDLKIPEQSNPDPKSIQEPVLTMKIGGDHESECMNCEESCTDVMVKKSALDLKNKHVTDSDQRPLSSNTPNNLPDMSEGRPIDCLEFETKFLLTEEYATPEFGLNSVGLTLASHDGEIHHKQGLMVQNNVGSSSGNGKSDTSLLSLSLSKGMPAREMKATDGSMGKDKGDLSPIRSNWDLNTPMDSWDGSDGDAAIPASNNALCTTTNQKSIPQCLNSTDSESIFINKGKQLIGTDEHISRHSSRRIASIQGNHEAEDSLRLTLGVASQGMDIDKGLSVEVASRKYVLDSRLPNAAISMANVGSMGSGMLKSQPSEDNSKKTSIGYPRGCIDSCSVKREPTERPDKESAGLPISIPEKLSGQTSIKAEPIMEANNEKNQVNDVALQHGLLKIGLFRYGASSSGLSVSLSPKKFPPSRLATSSELSASVGVSNQSDNCSPVQAAAVVNALAQKHVETEASGPEIDSLKNDTNFSNNSEIRQLKISRNHNNNLRVNGEGSVNDEEKLNISVETTEYEGYGSDCESDGKNQGLAIQLDNQDTCAREEDDFEDGEVREALAHLHAGDANAETFGTESVKLVNSDANPSVRIDHEIGNNMNDNTLGNQGDNTVDNMKECVDIVSIETDKQLTNQDAISTKLSLDRIAAVATIDNLLVDTSLITLGQIHACDNPFSAWNGTLDTMDEATDDNANSDGLGNKLDSSLSKVDATLKTDGACIESTNGGNKSRIINLPRTSVASPFETKSFPGSSLPSRSRREREETDFDGRHGFMRERTQDQHFRNSRTNYMRGRGRYNGRMGNPRVEWDSEREFPGRSSSDLHRFNQSKRSAAFNDMEIESSNYPIAQDGSPLAATNRGRKPMKESPSFHHHFSRRQSPADRDGPPTRDMQMLHKVPRNASPGRRNNDVHGANFVGLHQNEKFSRALRNDTVESSYSRSHSGYEDGDGQFVRGTRNFSTGNRRFFPRVRSKSPLDSRTHSPGPWSPRRRSPDRFKAMPKIGQRRSAALYGTDRMSSPDRPCFPEEIVARRRGSPSYVGRATNDPRDIDSGSEHGHPRHFNSRRSPSDRVFSRSSRRPDVMDSRIRGCDDEFFGRQPHSGGFREVNGEGSSDERRKCGERIHSFRPSYNADSDNRHSDNRRFHGNDNGPRSFRFYSDGDNTEYAGRNMGDREFDGRMKNRPTDGDNTEYAGRNMGDREFDGRMKNRPTDGDNTEYAGRNMGDREFDGRMKNRPTGPARRMNY